MKFAYIIIDGDGCVYASAESVEIATSIIEMDIEQSNLDDAKIVRVRYYTSGDDLNN